MPVRPYDRVGRVIRMALPVYWIGLVIGTHWPQLPGLDAGHVDKVAHFAAYAGLAALFALSLFWGRRPLWWQLALALAGLALFGAFDELTQPLFNRGASWYDWYADVAGISFGLLVAALICRSLAAPLPIHATEPQPATPNR